VTAADDLARLAEAVPAESREWAADTGRDDGEAWVYMLNPPRALPLHGFPEAAEFIAAANPATILRLIAALDEEGTENMNRRDALSFLKEERDALAARLAAIEALADEWECTEAYRCTNAGECSRCLAYQSAVIRLRAALSAAPTDTTKETS